MHFSQIKLIQRRNKYEMQVTPYQMEEFAVCPVKHSGLLAEPVAPANQQLPLFILVIYRMHNVRKAEN